MLRVIVGAFSLGLLVTLLADSADSAPARRALAGRAGGVASRATSGAAQNAASGRTTTGIRQHSGNASRLGTTNLPTGPISSSGVRPNAGSNAFPTPSQTGSSLQSVRDPLPAASHLQGSLEGQRSSMQGRLSDLATTYGVTPGGPAPFSPAWYTQHPNAWQITHPHAGEAFVAATAVGLASFMAIESAALAGGGSTTIVYGSEATAEQTQAATDLAQSGDGAVDPDGPWMPVGVFAFRPMDAPDATRMIHLAVNSQGKLRGAHYDLLSEETANIVGAVDRGTAQVSWKIGEGGHVVFESDLNQLTQPQGQVRVHFPDGQTGQWSVSQVRQ